MQNRPEVTVWCGMTATRVIGAYLLRDNMNAERCLQMLKITCGLSYLAGKTSMNLFSCTMVRAWLDQKFPGRWLGRRGPHEWPAGSPHLTPCDFFLWGWAKEEVYWAKPRTMEQLEDRIRNVITSVPHDSLQKTVDSIPSSLRKLVDAAGAYIEF